jgi:hypothetical protein
MTGEGGLGEGDSDPYQSHLIFKKNTSCERIKQEVFLFYFQSSIESRS